MKTCVKAIALGAVILSAGTYATWAEVVVPGSGESLREVSQDDKAFLKQIEKSNPPALSQPAPKTTQNKIQASEPARQKAEKTPVAKQGKKGKASPEASARSKPREAARLPRRITVVKTRIGPPLISEDEARDFVFDYLESIEGPSLSEEAQFYAEQVSYLGRGVVHKDSLLGAQARQREQWPDRSVYLESQPTIRYVREDEAVVTFRKSFQFENDERRMEGENVTELHIKVLPEGTKITSIEEH